MWTSWLFRPGITICYSNFTLLRNENVLRAKVSDFSPISSNHWVFLLCSTDSVNQLPKFRLLKSSLFSFQWFNSVRKEEGVPFICDLDNDEYTVIVLRLVQNSHLSKLLFWRGRRRNLCFSGLTLCSAIKDFQRSYAFYYELISVSIRAWFPLLKALVFLKRGWFTFRGRSYLPRL